MPIELHMQVPKAVMDNDAVQKAIVRALEKVSYPHVRDDFKQTVYGWKAENKPHFTKRLTVKAHEIDLFVYAREDEKGNIYRLVSSGSPPHRIPKTGFTFMKFKRGYRSATTPGILKSRRMYRSGHTVVRYAIDNPVHPGFEARKFDELVAEEYSPFFESDIQTEIDKVALKPDEAIEGKWQQITGK